MTDDLTLPSDGAVELPAGIYEPDGIIDTAEVRELNGFDEEAILKSPTAGAMLQAVLERAVIKLGDTELKGGSNSRAMLDQVPLGDRLELLVKIRKLTWGDVEVTPVCPFCQGKSQITIDLDKDVPRTALTDKANDRFWEVPLKLGTARVTLPSGALHRKFLSATNTNLAEQATWLIADTVMEVGDSLRTGIGLARSLSLGDRTKLALSMDEHVVGPQLEEVKVTCPECAEEYPFPLSLGAIFPFAA